MSTPHPDPDQALGDLVTARPGRTRVLERFALDYCCGGGRSLRAACAAAGVPVDEVVAAIAADDAAHAGEDTPGWAGLGLGALAGHILDVHHVFLKRELPRLGEYADKVVAAHGERHPELAQVRDVLAALRAELDAHLHKEERILFPWCQALASAVSLREVGAEGIGAPISVMLAEHEGAGEALASLRRLTGDYTPPADACPTYVAFLDGLRALEDDLHLHIHKESNLLFHLAQAREQELATAGA